MRRRRFAVRHTDPQSVTYAQLIGGKRFVGSIAGGSSSAAAFPHVATGRSIPRLDIPAKVTGAYGYLHNLRLPGMLHGRPIRPPSPGATLLSYSAASLGSIPVKIAIVRTGNFIGVVAESEWHAVRAARELHVSWSDAPALPSEETLYDTLRKAESTPRVVASAGDVDGTLTQTHALQATYQWPFQTHGSIGPSCAVADVRRSGTTIYSATQGVYPLRGAIAQLLDVPNARVRVVYVEGSGCYGHNGADDAAADAALLSRSVARPVRVQWSRADEHGWGSPRVRRW
jgi:nicotinate dehydrogenase subunit B